MSDSLPELNYSTRPPRGSLRWVRAGGLVAASFSFLCLAIVYGFYLFAWLRLGTRPRSSLHDPRDFEMVPGYLAVLTLVLTAWLPITVLGAGLCMWGVLRDGSRRRFWWISTLVLLVGAGLAAAAVWLDPGRVFAWLGD